jgi:hypothetical protein
MSFNPDPKWTPDINYPLPEKYYACPYCNKLPKNWEDIVLPLKHVTYYEARHIPEELRFTCDNPECSHRDMDYFVRLSVVITATLGQ